MNSTLVRFKDKNYYVDYDDLLNKANNKLFAYEDAELEVPAKLNGQTLMFDKSAMEDKLKKGIKMPTRMPSNLATENRGNKMTNEIQDYPIQGMNAIGLSKPEQNSIKSYERHFQQSHPEQINLFSVGPTGKVAVQATPHESYVIMKNGNTGEFIAMGIDTSQGAKRDKSLDKSNLDLDELMKEVLNLKENIMTNEQKLRKHIREIIIEILKEGGDPYGRPDEDKYLFKTDQDYLSGIQSEDVDAEGESAEELAAKETAAKEKAEKTAYSRFFSKALAKFGYSGAASIPDEKKREFYDFIDANWTSKQEAPKKKVDEDSKAEFQKRLDSPEPYPYKFNGRTYQVRSFGDEDSANEFMEKNSEWGVLDVKGAGQQYPQRDYYEVIVAKTDDMGWTDPAGGTHDWDEEDPAKMYEDTHNIDDVIPIEDAIKMKNSGKYDGADWYYYRGLLTQTGNPEQHGGINVDTNTWIVPAEFVKTHNVKNATYPAFYKNDSTIKETSATGGVAGYETPMAFTGKKGVSKKQKSIANQLGYELVDNKYSVKEEETQRLDESMDTLYFKDESLTAEQKLGLAMRHVRNNLYEVEKIVKKAIKMKNEENIDSTKVGKRTYSALKRINEKVIRLMVAIQDLK